MNNFRNPDVNPDSFQGKVYDYYRPRTNPVHTTIDNQERPEQKEMQQNRTSNEYDETKNRSLYINNRIKKVNVSKPVIFSPPKVDSIEKPLNENTSDELTVISVADNNTHIEKKGREEVVSNLMKEFSLMLDDNSSMQEEFTTLPETEADNDPLFSSSESTSASENSLDDEYTAHPDYENITENHGTVEEKFITLFSESDESREVMQNTTEEVKTYTDPREENFFALFSESDESEKVQRDRNRTEREIEALIKNTDPLEDKYTAMLLVSDELQNGKQSRNTNEAEIDVLDESAETLVDKFITILSESDELEEEKQDCNTEEELNTLNKNTDILEDKFSSILSKSDDLQEEKQDCSFTNFEVTKSDDDHINKNNPSPIACHKEIDDEQLFQKHTCFADFSEKKNIITVKMPVLLAELETDIDIIETIDLIMSPDDILKVEWSVQSLDCKVVLPSRTAFLKGEFIAEIEFSSKVSENKIQSLKISVPWSKTAAINWITIPDLPDRNQKEFMFQPHHEYDSNYHYESYREFTEPIQSQLKQVHFVWHQELNSMEKQIEINGIAQLSIRFMQDQFIELDCYSE